jgi:AraC-like DNA-binding protein
MAKVVALSPGHFAHAFREATGVAPHRYVLELRVNRAKTLLRQSDLPITESRTRRLLESQSFFGAVPSRRWPDASPVPFARRLAKRQRDTTLILPVAGLIVPGKSM